MPKLGMAPVRRAQLIDATLESVASYGLRATTVSKICEIAGLSPGIISHYFGGKKQLLEATVWYLINSLQKDLVRELKKREPLTPKERLNIIVEVNFNHVQMSEKVSIAWLSFWAEAVHDPAFARLQRINERRLYSNIKYSMNYIVGSEKSDYQSHILSAMIDGLWIRASVKTGSMGLKQAVTICKQYVEGL